MKTLLATSLTALSLVLGGSAMAATQSTETMATCEQLMKQFDGAVVNHATAPRIKQAKDMRSAGEKACKKGNYTKGVSDLHAALNDIGVKPTSN